VVEQRLLLRLSHCQLPRIVGIRQATPRQVSFRLNVSSRHLIHRYVLAYILIRFSIIWAVILGCHGAGQSFAGLCVLRILLGMAESTVSPGFSLLTGIWYKPSEHAWRHGIWFLGNGIANTFGGLLAYGIAHITGSLATWRVSNTSPIQHISFRVSLSSMYWKLMI
jgi:MFS family permease